MPVPDLLKGDYTRLGAWTPNAKFGVEIRNPEVWSRERRYKNWCKQATGWTEYNAGTWILSGNDVVLTSDGYPQVIPAGKVHRSEIQAVWTAFAGNGGRNDGTFPAGEYVFTYDGDVDTLTLNGTGISVTHTEPGRMEFTSDGSATIYLEMSGTINQPLHNFMICEDKYEGDWETGDYWYPETLKELKHFKCIEFEAWLICPGWPSANTPYPTWDQRRAPDYYCYHNQPIWSSADAFTAGKDFRHMPYELQADLINKLEVDIWITIPYWASDDYVVNLARFMHEHLHKDAGIYIEYGGEPFFDGDVASPVSYGGEYMFDQGVAAAYANPQIDFYALRAEQVFSLFKATIPERTVHACVTSKPIDTGILRADWIANLRAHVLGGSIPSADEWSTSVYIGGSVDKDAGSGMGDTWANWVASGTVSQANAYMNQDLLNTLATLDGFLGTISDVPLKKGMYEFGFTGSVVNFEGVADAEADTIGDIMRAAHKTEDEYWRVMYLFNWLVEHMDGIMIIYCAATPHANATMWGIADTNADLSPKRPYHLHMVDDVHPRYYAIKEFLKGDRFLSYLGANRK